MMDFTEMFDLRTVLKNYFLKFIIPAITAFILTAISACGLFYFNETPTHEGNSLASAAEESFNINATGETDKKDESGSNDQVLFEVTEVIDGDTFIINNFERIRLTGINTPEDGMYFYEEAKQVLKIIAEGKMVELEKDISEKDKYGRLLRYAFIKDLFINLEMVKRGFANVYTMPPDIKYQQYFLEAERYARDNSLGLWELSPYSLKNTSSGQEDTGAIIVRINYDAAGDDSKNMNDEYIIFSNNSGEDIDIGGWTVKDSGTNIYEFKEYVFKDGSEIILFTGPGNDDESKFYWNSKMPVWNNSGDTLYLRERSGLLVEMLSY